MHDGKGLTEAGDFGSFGRYDEVALAQMTPEMKEAYEHTMKLRGIVPGPHKIWLANAKLSRMIVPIGAYYQKESTLTTGPVRYSSARATETPACSSRVRLPIRQKSTPMAVNASTGMSSVHR